MSSRRLIINADDLGISTGTNEGIFAAHESGIVTSASLMPNMPAFEDALRRLRDRPELSVGLHTTLTAGRPLSPFEAVSTLVRPDGTFQPLPSFLRRLYLGRIDAREVAAEVDAQIERCVSAGVRLAHINSHHHVHFHPTLFPIFREAAYRRRIPWLRGGRIDPFEPWKVRRLHPFRPGSWRGWARLMMLARYSHVETGEPATTDHLLGLGFVAPGGYRQALRAWLSRCPAGVSELVCHPGRPDEELQHIDTWTEMRAEEWDALTDPEIENLVQSERIALQKTPQH